MKKILLALLLTICLSTHSSATSIWVYNTSDGSAILHSGELYVRPIASISKLMTAMVSLDYNPDIGAPIPMVKRLSKKKKWFTRHDMMAAMLIRSDNAAAEAIAADYPGGRTAFLAAMNAKAKQLNMHFTQFHDPSGISHGNVSTAVEVGKMVAAASKYGVIRDLSHQKQVSIKTQFKKSIRTVTLNNTNIKTLNEFDSIVVSKTGFTSAAGYCLTMLATSHNQEFVIVVLGESNKNYRKRTVDKIMNSYVLASNYR